LARARKQAVREPLSRERIEDAAFELIERDGLEVFSTRRLASALGCEAMSIYHYFQSKQHLMDALVDRFLGAVERPPEGLPPLETMRRLAYSFRTLAHRYPEFLRYLSFHRLNTPGGIKYLGEVLDAAFALGGDVETTARLFRVLGYYLTGAILDETSGYARGHSAAEPVADEVIIRDHPAVVAVNPYFKADQHEKTFALGLEILLDGLMKTIRAAKKAGRAKSGPPAGRRRRSPHRSS
jgi:AcrR family transcriptional regulator